MPPEAAMGFVGSIGLVALLAIPVALFIGAIFINAVYRPILRPQDRGFFYLKLGGDEGRLVLLFLAFIGLGILAEIALVVGAIAAVAAIKGVFAASHASLGLLTPRLVGFLFFLALFFLVVWIVIRFSLAAPMTFARRKVSVFSAWSVTKGKFWSLLGCYILAWIFGILIALLGWIVSLAAGAVVTGDWTTLSGAMVNPRAAMMGSSLSMLTHAFTVAVIVQVVLSSLMSAVSRVIMYAPMAAAYRDLTGSSEPSASFGDVDPSSTPPGVLVL
ncbi:MAG: hypothetical protein M3N05_03575 [Pseudomonadota bacterium]|nr:hypothetical protein [Pseudomonadota bacterium]